MNTAQSGNGCHIILKGVTNKDWEYSVGREFNVVGGYNYVVKAKISWVCGGRTFGYEHYSVDLERSEKEKLKDDGSCTKYGIDGPK